MNNKVNYTMVGLFVLIAIVFIMSFAYWLLKPSSEDEMKNYIIYFDESVLGLNIDASVKYKGIEVGKVKRLSINPNNSEQVEVLISILKDTPIKEDTAAKLTPQGITGLSYINLSQGSNLSQHLKIKHGEKYPVIKTEPSLFNQLEESFGSMSENLNNTLIRAHRMLNDENQKQLSKVLEKTASFMDKMDMMLNEQTIKNFQSSMENLNSSTKHLNDVMPKVDAFVDNSIKWEDNISASMNSIKTAYVKVGMTMDEIRGAISSDQFNFKDIANDVVPNINNTLLEMQQMMIKVEESLERHNRSPSDILFKEEMIKKGPGEK
jgi:phospholipid/cholesterol/gamma-HCH transport system substrate-binding protein